MLVDFSYHMQIHDWGLIYFHLKEENAWDIIFEVTNFRLFLSARTSIMRVWMWVGGGGVWYLLFIENLAHFSSH